MQIIIYGKRKDYSFLTLTAQICLKKAKIDRVFYRICKKVKKFSLNFCQAIEEMKKM